MQHKKALKDLEGEKRAALKKAKALKGQKGKDAVAAIEADFAAKVQALEQQYTIKVEVAGGAAGDEPSTAAVRGDGYGDGGAASAEPIAEPESDNPSSELLEKERKLEKARRKKEKQRLKEREKKRELEEIAAGAGPNMRYVEMQQIQTRQLDPLQLTIEEVAADGHCLYRAIGAQTKQDYQQIRSLCADTLQAHPEEFAPFCEFTDKVRSFDDYVNQVRNSAEWGGHLELRALSRALHRPIFVYSTREPLEIKEESLSPNNLDNPIRLSYHHHYYALGEHYNQVVVKQE